METISIKRPRAVAAAKNPNQGSPPPVRAGGLPKGFRPSARLGQNFLIDDNIARKIAAFATCSAGDTVVELGAGAGALTRILAPLVGRLLAVEIDRRLLASLASAFAAFDNVEVLRGDVRTFDYAAISTSSPLKVVGNIPYYASSEIIFNLLAKRAFIKSATLMMQKELAIRLCAAPGGKDYGIPTVILGMFADIVKGFDAAPSCFRPTPQVVSTVVRFDFLGTSRLALADEQCFIRLVRGLFAQRRKNIFNNLKNTLADCGAIPRADVGALAMELLQKAGISPQARAESLHLSDFAALANLVAAQFGLGDERLGSK